MASKALIHDTIIIHGTPVGNHSINGYFYGVEKRKHFCCKKGNKKIKKEEGTDVKNNQTAQRTIVGVGSLLAAVVVLFSGSGNGIKSPLKITSLLIPFI